MTNEEIKVTPIWGLYEKGRNYHRRIGIYTDTDKNYRFYNGNQWEGAKLADVEPVQKNFIKPIVKYKLSVLHSNLYSIQYSSQNFSNPGFVETAEKCCEMLNRYAHRVWEQDKMDFKCRIITKDAAINDEGILYVNFDSEKLMPLNEIIKKNDVYYGNENDDDLQAQPYILIRKRMPEAAAVEFALNMGVSSEEAMNIKGDNDTFEQSGEAAKIELDDMVTLVYKFYKENGTVHFSVASRYVDIIKDEDIGISLYPLAHMNWEAKEGSARGEGEVRFLIPNQIEVNKTEVRRIVSVKSQAFPQKVVDTSKVSSLDSLNTIGAIIKTNGHPVDDVRKIVGTLPPAQMSPDVKQLQEDLINITRDLAGAGDTATGNVNPESASGRAILAVQQASQAPMTEQRETFKNFIEDVARIWFEYLMVYSEDGIALEEEVTDAEGNEHINMVTVPQSVLKALQASVKIDITPRSPFDKFAQEQTLENLLTQGMFNVQRLPELKAYAKTLDDDSVAPKRKILELIKYMENEQRRIMQIQQKAQQMQQRAQQFLMGDENVQASQMADAVRQLEQQQAMAHEEPTE